MAEVRLIGCDILFLMVEDIYGVEQRFLKATVSRFYRRNTQSSTIITQADSCLRHIWDVLVAMVGYNLPAWPGSTLG